MLYVMLAGVLALVDAAAEARGRAAVEVNGTGKPNAAGMTPAEEAAEMESAREAFWRSLDWSSRAGR